MLNKQDINTLIVAAIGYFLQFGLNRLGSEFFLLRWLETAAIVLFISATAFFVTKMCSKAWHAGKKEIGR